MSAMASTKSEKFTGEVLVGHCAVDSGQLMITDPCYAEQWLDETRTEGGSYDGQLTPDAEGSYPYSYNGACSATLSGARFGQLKNGLGVAFSTGGDGTYDVTAKYENGEIVSITIHIALTEAEQEAEAEAERRWEETFSSYDPYQSYRIANMDYEDYRNSFRDGAGLDFPWNKDSEEDSQ